MPDHFAFIEAFLRPVGLYGKQPAYDTHSIIHLDMRHTEFVMEFNSSDDRPTQKIVASRPRFRPGATIHVAVGYLADTQGGIQIHDERDLVYETEKQAIAAFLQLFDYCLAFGLQDRARRGENLVLDVFRQGRSQ